ncbi:glycosyltransferase family 4 protein [Sporofaciens musculi]|uniref:glycosyltransferase family 4 protein n=1 Tax=Sporofaciens musculi TaxID=2681861 RepID=UPI0025A1E5F1|nr:glycosyltransferase family 4 protein [Sporofaciens musculi]
MRRTYVIDDILLFNPNLSDDGDVYYLNELNKNRKYKWNPIIEFITADIYSIIDITNKMLIVFGFFGPLTVILRDDTKKKIVTVIDLLFLMANKEWDNKRKSELTDKVNADIDNILKRKSKKTQGISDSVYIKTTMCFGIQSGGAVAHSAGVISAMKTIFSDMEVYTTDFLPEKLMDGNVTKISLAGFQDYYYEAKMYLNISAYNEIINRHGNKRPMFVYQRYSLYDYIGARISEKYNVPFVLEWNGSEIWISKNWDNVKFQYRSIAEKIERLNLEKADLITCVSKELKASLISLGVPGDKILVNFNGVDINKFSPSVNGDGIRKKYGTEDRIVIGFCGSFAKFHGAEILAETFGNILNHHRNYKNKITLMMIGEGSTLVNVKRILKRNRAIDNAICVGSVAADDVPEYLAACDILVASHIPNNDGSEFFGSPTKLFEYMAMGKAIAAAELNQIGEILHDNKNALLFEPGDIDEMEETIVSLIEDDNLRMRLGKQARDDAGRYHTWDIHVDRIIVRLREMGLLK